MARGYIYEYAYANAPDAELGAMSEEFFYDRSGYCWDFAKNVVGEEANYLRDTFISRFASFGAVIVDAKERGDNVIFYDREGSDVSKVTGFILTNAVKERYFQEKFNCLKGLVNNLTLHDFATGSTYELECSIDNNHEDCMYNDILNTMDDWVRNAPVDVPIYIGNIVLIH